MALTRTYILVHLVEKYAAGYVFEKTRSAWPLHITLVPWFEINEIFIDVLREDLSIYVDQTKPFIAPVGEEQYLISSGESGVLVNVMAKQDPIHELHNSLMDIIDLSGAKLLNQDQVFVRQKYLAHITHHSVNGITHQREEGDVVSFDGVTLVELVRPKMCKVVETFYLTGGLR